MVITKCFYFFFDNKKGVEFTRKHGINYSKKSKNKDRCPSRERENDRMYDVLLRSIGGNSAQNMAPMCVRCCDRA